MCSGSEVGSYLRLIDFLYHSTLGLRVTKKKKKMRDFLLSLGVRNEGFRFSVFLRTLVYLVIYDSG